MTSTSTTPPQPNKNHKDLIRKLLKGIETGDPAAATVVNEAVYIQHNPQTAEGSEGLAALFARLAKTNPRVNVVRAFQDGAHVFCHTEYDFSTRRIGFEVFRFDMEKHQAVEHWDNIQPRMNGDAMITGPTQAVDLDRTEANRQRVHSFVKEVLVGREFDKLTEYVAADLVQHSPYVAESGRTGLQSYLTDDTTESLNVQYQTLHRILAEGNFVLTVCEGQSTAKGHSSFYDLYRLHDNFIVEHWDTIESVPPVSEWKNNNGKF